MLPLLPSAVRSRRETTRRLRRAAQVLADEEAALQRVAEAAAGDADPAPALAVAARELAVLLGTEVGGIVRFDGPRSFAVDGGYSRLPSCGPHELPGVLAPGADSGALRAGQTARRDARATGSDPWGVVQRVAAPVLVGDRVWGAVAVATTSPERLPDDTEQHLGRFADLVALAVAA